MCQKYYLWTINHKTTINEENFTIGNGIRGCLIGICAERRRSAGD